MIWDFARQVPWPVYTGLGYLLVVWIVARAATAAHRRHCARWQPCEPATTLHLTLKQVH